MYLMEIKMFFLVIVCEGCREWKFKVLGYMELEV